MKNLTVGIFHAGNLGNELGKKGTESDILFHNSKRDDGIYTFMEPVAGKVVPKAEIASSIDAAVISFESMSPEVGETVLMLDSIGVKQGIVLVPEFADLKQITSVTKGSSLESFVIKPNDPKAVMEYISKLDSEKPAKPTIIEIDHAFSVRGVGEVLLGFVKSGTVRKHDKLSLMPGGKEVVVRSIQMHDKDFDEAAAGSRVGLAIKGATVDEMPRGSVICEPGAVSCGKDIKLKVEKNQFYKGDVKAKCHVVVGMQSCPAALTNDGIEAEKPLVYTSKSVFLLLDLNAEKTHLIGKALPSP